ncbi:MAG: TlpA family protein disulfide reductase [Bacteroidales bacterium]|nr:TlpA family protein disulfide reductase [Bacteroidales bacterium]
MKRILTLIIALAAVVASKAQTTINFDVTGLNNGLSVTLFKVEGRGGVSVLTQKIEDNKFKCTFTCDSLMENLSYFRVVVTNNETHEQFGNTSIYLHPNSTIHVKGTGNDPKDWTNDSNHPGQKFYNVMFTNDKSKAIQDEMKKLNAQASNPEADMKALNHAFDSLLNVDNKLRVKTLETLPKDEYWIEYYAIMARAAVASSTVDNELIESLTNLYSRLTEEDKQTADGKTITANIFNKPVNIGDPMKDYDLYDIDGNLHHLAEFKGKDLLVDFSSYFCGPCLIISPLLDFLYKAGNKSFNVVTVNNDTKSQFEEHTRAHGVSFPVLNDRDGDGGIFGIYKIKGIPNFYLFSPDGIVKDKWMGAYPEKVFNAITQSSSFKWNTSVEKKGNAKVVNYPPIESINSIFIAEKVTLYADSTVIDFLSCSPAFSFGSGSTLHYNGKQYKVISSSIGLDKFVEGMVGHGSHVTATFEPLPMDATKFDYIEGDCDNCFKILGIELPE